VGRPPPGATAAGYNGPDVDLHVLHPNAGNPLTSHNPDADGDGLPYPWYDVPWDCFWYNPTPQKGGTDGWDPDAPAPWVDNAVAMTYQSDDGYSPEVVRIGLECSTGRVYRIGAHFFDDHGYGPVTATLQGYVNGVLAQTQVQALNPLDRWNAATLTCGTNAVAAVTPTDVFPNYSNPGFVLPP